MSQSIVSKKTLTVRQSKFKTEKSNSEMRNSGKLGITLPELQKYQKYCLQQKEDSDQSLLNQLQSKIMQLQCKKKLINQKARIKLDNDHSFSQNYCVDDQLRYKQKVPLSAYQFSGYSIVDHNEKINRLHRQLLKKVVLNR